MVSRVLITGGSGLLALNWALTIRGQCAVVLGMHQRQVCLSGTQTAKLDLESVEQLSGSLENLRPDVVIHAAGLTLVEKCEAEPDLARHVNVDLAANVAAACARQDVKLVYISTDHLFAGDHPFADEKRPVAPVNVYARTKAEAEQRTLRIHPRSLIIRTNFYGWGTSYRHSFSDVVIQSLRTGNSINLFEDVFFTPLLAETLSQTVHRILALDEKGIYNVVGDERISKYEFGLKIADLFGLDRDLIKRGRIAELPGLVRRPLDMSLCNKKTRKLLGSVLGDVDTQLARLREQETTVTQELQEL